MAEVRPVTWVTARVGRCRGTAVAGSSLRAVPTMCGAPASPGSDSRFALAVTAKQRPQLRPPDFDLLPLPPRGTFDGGRSSSPRVVPACGRHGGLPCESTIGSPAGELPSACGQRQIRRDREPHAGSRIGTIRRRMRAHGALPATAGHAGPNGSVKARCCAPNAPCRSPRCAAAFRLPAQLLEVRKP